jgi:hypothetical protein
MRVRALLKLIGPLLCTLALLGENVCQTSSERPRQEIPASFFGMHIHHMVSPNGTDPLTPWPSINVPEWRLWDARVTWPDLEPNKNQWRFDNLDKSLAMAEAHHTEVLMTLGLTPRWASARPEEPSAYQPGFAAEPKDMEDWRTFVRTVATRYKGRIHAYEIWNEPNLKQFWSGTTDQLLALTREAHNIIKSVDPAAVIVSPSATGAHGTPWLSEFLSKGGGQFVDVIGYHFYVTPKPPEEMVPLVQSVKQIMANQGVDEKPLWGTESGWLPPAHIGTEELGAAYLARSYILLCASGVQRFYWYAWDNHRWVSIETTEQDSRTLTPAGRSYGVIQNWLVGARLDWCNDDTGGTWVCQLNRNEKPEWIVWNPDGTKPFALAPSWKIGTITTLLQEPHTFVGYSVDVGRLPELLTRATGPASPN